MGSGDIVAVTLHFGHHLEINPIHPHYLENRLDYYEDCIWIVSSVDAVAGYTIRILNTTLLTRVEFGWDFDQHETLRHTDTLLMFGYGHTPQDSWSRIYDASTAKPLNWFALNTSEVWIRYEQINHGPGVEFEIESHGNYMKYKLVHIFN